MKKNFLLLLSCIAISAAVTSCTKDPLDHLTNDESRIYITNYDSTANFSSFKTFSISDSVDVITNGQATRERDTVDAAFLAAATKYMQQAGYTLVDKSQSPDLAINVNRIYNTSTGILSYGDYYDDYGAYWDPGYWGYLGYGYYVPYSYAVYQITEGAFSIDMLDLKDAAAKGNINIIWTGLIRGEAIFDPATADTQVQTLFFQSPYLKASN